MSGSSKKIPEWDRALSAAARLQQIIPDAVLDGDTAAAIYDGHKTSLDDGRLFIGLRDKFDTILAQLEDVAGWKTARTNRSVSILGSLDGIETGVRQLRRTEPLETRVVFYQGYSLTIPTEAEVLRIKGFLILRRNAVRDYLDFAALADFLKTPSVIDALVNFDSLYPQQNSQSALQQLLAQLSNPMPFDFYKVDLSEYTYINSPFNEWSYVHDICTHIAPELFASNRIAPCRSEVLNFSTHTRSE
jgi:hypothetical protein